MNMWKHAAAVLVVAGLVLSSCSNGQNGAGTQGGASAVEQTMNGQIITQISRPDEALQALASKTDPAVWKDLVDGSTFTAGSDRAMIAYALGAQAANAAFASIVKDTATADKLAASLKDLAAALNVKSDTLEKAIAKLVQDQAEADAAARDAKLRRNLDTVSNEIKSALNAMGNGYEATLIVFGAWVESVRFVSAALVKDNNVARSGLLNRKVEAEYFLAQFTSAAGKGDALAARVAPVLAELNVAMSATKDYVFDAAGMKAVNDKVVALAAAVKK